MKKIHFADNLRKYREKRELTKEELGERIGVSGVTIGYWESGRNEPRMGKVDLIAKVLDVTIDDLLFDTQISEVSGLHNREISDLQKRAIELILELPEDEVKMFNLLMERSLNKED